MGKPVPQPVKTSYRAGRGGDGRFLRGSRGNPNGRPPGSRNRASILMENLLDGRARALTEKAIKMALTGDALALRLCLERLMPARRERSLTLRLPAPTTAQDIAAGFAGVVEALAHGELTPAETSAVAELLESARRALETTDLAERIEELEARAEEAEGSRQ